MISKGFVTPSTQVPGKLILPGSDDGMARNLGFKTLAPN